MDAARADHFSCYGYERPTTPNIDRIAAEGLRFTQAVSTSSWTLPAHVSLFTGLLPREHGTHAQHTWLIDRIPTLAELLREKGYHTAGFSNNPWISSTYNLSQGFEMFKEIWVDFGDVALHQFADAEQTNMLVTQYLEENVFSPDPFFIFINYMDVHIPYDPPEPYRSLFLGKDQKISSRIDSANQSSQLVNKGILKLTDSEYKILRDIYDGALVYLDSKIGELLGNLKSRGLYENTLVIITSDHGEVFGEYGLFTHGALLYRPLVQIPLIIHNSQLTGPPAVRDTPVSITDIFYTIVHLLKLEEQVYPTGARLSYLLDPDIQKKPCYSELKVDRVGDKLGSEKNDIRALWTADRKHYLLCENESYECYDLVVDPAEVNNLCPEKISIDGVAEKITLFEGHLIEFVENDMDLRRSPDRRVNPQQIEAMRALGYVGVGLPDSLIEGGEEQVHVMEHFKTGIFFLANDSLGAAEREIRRAILMSPNNYTIRRYLGGILYKQGNYEEAARVLRSLLGKTLMDTRIRILYGLSLAGLKKYDEALEQFDKALEGNPADLIALNHALEIVLQKNRFEKAERYLELALAQGLDNLNVLRKAAAVYFKMGRYSRARDLLLKLLEQDASPQTILMLATVCKQMGLMDEYKLHLEKAVELDLPLNIRKAVEQDLDKLLPNSVNGLQN